jgi:hypothetical protein
MPVTPFQPVHAATEAQAAKGSLPQGNQKRIGQLGDFGIGRVGDIGSLYQTRSFILSLSKDASCHCVHAACWKLTFRDSCDII